MFLADSDSWVMLLMNVVFRDGENSVLPLTKSKAVPSSLVMVTVFSFLHTHTHTHTHSNFLFFFSFLFFNFYNIVMVSAVQQCKISHQFSSVQSLSRLGLCDSMNRSMPGLPVDHQLPESTIIITVSPRHPEPPSLPASRSSQSTRLGSLCFAAISPQLST